MIQTPDQQMAKFEVFIWNFSQMANGHDLRPRSRKWKDRNRRLALFKNWPFTWELAIRFFWRLFEYFPPRFSILLNSPLVCQDQSLGHIKSVNGLSTFNDFLELFSESGEKLIQMSEVWFSILFLGMVYNEIQYNNHRRRHFHGT